MRAARPGRSDAARQAERAMAPDAPARMVKMPFVSDLERREADCPIGAAA
ncbi:MAG: hypothetical protein RMK90_00235 [Acetobacteraceae bacterium]|nr:hypothetical protein [Acetobacteraceae bacterium]